MFQCPRCSQAAAMQTWKCIYFYSNSIWLSAQQSILETPSFEQVLIKNVVMLRAGPSSWKSFRLLVHLSVSEELLGCTLRWWKKASIPFEAYPQCQKEYNVHGVQGTVCISTRRYSSSGNSPRAGETWLQLSALRTADVSLKTWMKSMNHPHSRERNRKVFPVPPALKYKWVLGSLCCRETSLQKSWVE